MNDELCVPLRRSPFIIHPESCVILMELMQMLMREHSNDAPWNPAGRHYRSTAITLLKSRLLQEPHFTPCRGCVAPPSRLQTHSSSFHRRPPDPVRRRVSASSLLPAARLAPPFPGKRPLCATQQH